MACVPLDEQETTISLMRTNDTAIVYTSDSTWMTKMDHMVERNPEQFKVIEEQKSGERIISKKYEMPKRLVSIRSKTVAREMTEEQRAAAAERMKALAEKQKAQKAGN